MYAYLYTLLNRKADFVLLYNEVTGESKEIVIYTEDDLLVKGNENIKEIYSELKNRILDLGNVKIEPKKLYIAFKGKTNICDVVSKSQLKLFINLKEGQLKDDLKRTRIVTEIGHWGNGDYEISLKEIGELDYIMSLIKQSYAANI